MCGGRVDGCVGEGVAFRERYEEKVGALRDDAEESRMKQHL